jgi:hypothetical protein
MCLLLPQAWPCSGVDGGDPLDMESSSEYKKENLSKVPCSHILIFINLFGHLLMEKLIPKLSIF